MSKYIILNEDGQFCAGEIFYSEFPDAEGFDRFRDAIVRARAMVKLYDEPIRIFENYGLSNERQKYRISPDGAK